MKHKGCLHPVSSSCIQEGKSPYDVGPDEGFRPGDGIVYMRFGRKMNYTTHRVPFEKLINQNTIANISLYKFITRMVRQFHQVFLRARIGEGIQVDDTKVYMPFQEIRNKIRTNKSCTTRDQNSFHVLDSSRIKNQIESRSNRGASYPC